MEKRYEQADIVRVSSTEAIFSDPNFPNGEAWYYADDMGEPDEVWTDEIWYDAPGFDEPDDWRGFPDAGF